MCHSFLIHSSDDEHLGCFHERVDFPGVQEKRTLFPPAFTSALWGSFLLALNEIQGYPMTFLITLRWGYVLVLQSSPTLCDPMDCNPPGPSSWNSPGKNTQVCSHSLFQGIFPSQGSNPDLLHWRQILYRLSHQGSPIASNKTKHQN